MNNLRPSEKIFLTNLFDKIYESQANYQIIYPIFQANLDILTIDFAERLQDWGIYHIKELSPEYSEMFVKPLFFFSQLILDFPLGNKSANIRIAKAGYECSLTFYTKEKYPLVWAEIQTKLGIVCEEDPQGDPVLKWENAIAFYEQASQVFTYESYPQQWAKIQDHLGNAYRNRKKDEPEINLKQAIIYHQKALEFFNSDTNSPFWGATKHNLGSDYFALSRLNIENNEQYLEIAITHFEEALSILTQDIYPNLWAMNQLSLGNAYSLRLRGNPKQNHEKSQYHYENALSVYTPETYPEYYQQVKTGQTRLISRFKTDSNRQTSKESFINQVLMLSLASSEDIQKVFSFLEKHLDKLNEKFIDELTSFISDVHQKTDLLHISQQEKSEIKESFIMCIYSFSNLMNIFPAGKQATNLDIAITGWEISLKFFQDQPVNIIPNIVLDIQFRLGSAFYIKYQNKSGDLSFNLEKTIMYFENALSLAQAQNYLDQELLADIQDKLGGAYFYRNRIEPDPNNIEKAISAYESALKYLPSDSMDWARVQNNLGNAYFERKKGGELINLNRAIECYEKAKKVSEQNTESTIWADVQISLSIVYYTKALLGHSIAEDITASIQYAKNAEKFYNDEKKSQYPERWALVKYRLGIAYSDQGYNNHSENINIAIDCLNQALSVCTQEKDPYIWSCIKRNLGVIYFQKSLAGRGDRIVNIKSSIQFLEEASNFLKISQDEYPSDYAETQRLLARNYRHLAKYTGEAIKLNKAFDLADSAVNICIQNHVSGEGLRKSYEELATCHKDMGAFGENKEGNLTKSIEGYQKALALISRETHPFDWGNITNSLGNAYKHNGEYDKAINCFKDTLQIHTRENFPTDYIKTLTNLGKTHADYNQFNDAFNCYKEAIDTLEIDLIDKLLADDDAKRKLGEEWFKIYQFVIVVCLQLGKQEPSYYARAWEYAERSKARRLVELFGLTKPNDISDGKKEFQDLRNQITHEEKWIEDKEKLIILSQDNLLEQSELDSKKANLNNLKQLLNQKLNEDPKLASTQRIPYTLFSEISKKLADDHTVIIQWHLLEADQKFCAFIYTRQSFQPYIWESSSQDLYDLQQWYQEYFINYISDFNEWRNKLSEQLNRLAKILHIDKLLNYLPINCQQLILIPHRYLHWLPIHALPIKPETFMKFNHKSIPNYDYYLFECFKGVRYAPSCQALIAIQDRNSLNFSQLFAIQNPTEDLHYADLEVEAILNLFDSNSRKVFVHKQATKDNITLSKYLNTANCIHFSCHGTFNQESPTDSGLKLANGEILKLDEIFKFELRQSPLVILSACETGMIDPNSITDEYIGLSSAFLYGGASNVVSSLWTVNDCSSAILLIKFYQNLLQQKHSVIEALLEAQNWLRNITSSGLNDWIKENKLNQLRLMLRSNLLPNQEKPFSSPYYWAAFCVIGK